MQHGWTVRGGEYVDAPANSLTKSLIFNLDMTDPAVSRDVKKAITETLKFLEKYL